MMLDAFGTRLGLGTTVYFSPGGTSCAPVRAEVTDFGRGQVRVTVVGLPVSGAPVLGLKLGSSRWLDPSGLAVLEHPARLHDPELTRSDLALGGYAPGNHS